MPHLLEWLVKEQPDVACLQELKSIDDGFPHERIDSLREQHSGEAIYTFWDYFRKHWESNSGLRIDHLLLNAELAPCLVDANVDRWVRGSEKASDHAPTWVELDLSKLKPHQAAEAAKAVKKKPAAKKLAKPA